MLPSLRARVKRLVQNDLDVLSHPKVALSNYFFSLAFISPDYSRVELHSTQLLFEKELKTILPRTPCFEA